jgi:hypothetical protein
VHESGKGGTGGVGRRNPIVFAAKEYPSYTAIVLNNNGKKERMRA